MSGLYRALGPDGFGVYFVEFTGGQPQFERVEKAADRLLVPGFVDIHIHGAYGIDFMSAPTTELEVLCEKLALDGYETLLLTTVTAPAEAVLQAIDRLPECSMILGFHLEGPFISDAYPGAQPQEHIIGPPVGPSEWDAILDHPLLKVVTLAPERAGGLELTSRLMKRGVRVGMGHTNATYDEARRGFEFGATHTTHTFNAMRPFHHREAGPVGYALQNDALYCELIYDRLHVCREAAALLLRSKPSDKVVAISDGTMAAGLPPRTAVEMWGLRATTGRGDVRLADGTLAGSAVTLHTVFKNLLADFGEETAIRCCCLNPRKLLGLTDPPRVWLELDGEGEIAKRFSP